MAGAVMVQHVLVALLVTVSPVLGRRDFQRPKAQGTAAAKLHFYRKSIAELWAVTLVAGCVVGLLPLMTLRETGGPMVWLAEHPAARAAIAVTLALLFGLLLATAVRTGLSRERRERVGAKLKRMAFFLPQTRVERRWFAALSATAGVCEEFLFRGFLPHYFHAGPFHLGLIVALLVSSAIFGLGHLYQGVMGVVSTGVMGALFGALYLLTGGLLAPMVVHAAVDLRILLMLPVEEGEGARAEVEAG